jgi:hypothetical protein
LHVEAYVAAIARTKLANASRNGAANAGSAAGADRAFKKVVQPHKDAK